MSSILKIFLIPLCFLLILNIDYLRPSAVVSTKNCRVLDGDTVEIRYAGKCERARLNYIDAPELGQSQKQLAEISIHYLKHFTSGPIKAKILGRGYYKRLLVELYSKGESLNLEMLKKGMVSLYPYSTFESRAQKSAYIRAFRLAQIQKAGIWSRPFYLSPHYQRKLKKKAITTNASR